MNKLKSYKIDYISIFIYISLVFIGCLSVYSSSYNIEIDSHLLSLNTIIGKQVFFVFIAFIVGILILLIDIKVIIRSSYLIYVFSIISLILVLVIGKEVGGAKAWFDFGLFGLQPAEFAKFGTILAIAKFIHDNDTYLEKLKELVIILSLLLTPCLLILKQPDAGSALIYTSLIIVFFREGLPLRYIISMTTISILSLSTVIAGVHPTIIGLIFFTLIIAYILKNINKNLRLHLFF